MNLTSGGCATFLDPIDAGAASVRGVKDLIGERGCRSPVPCAGAGRVLTGEQGLEHKLARRRP